MAANKLNDLTRIKAKEIITSVFLFGGDEQAAIDAVFQELGVRLSDRQIRYYLEEIKPSLKQASDQKIQGTLDDIRAEELAKLKYLELQVIQQWNRSKENAETISTESVGVNEEDLNQIKQDLPPSNRFDGDPRDPDPELTSLKIQVKTKEKRKISGRTGDPRYIKALVDIQIRRAQLLGLDKKDDKQDWREQLRKAGLEETTINAIEYQLTELIAKLIAGANTSSNTQGEENSYIA